MSGMIPRPADASAQLVDRAATPSSISSTIRALAGYRHLLRNLVLKDLKLKYRGSVLGFLWSLANPLLMIVVYTIAFTVLPATRVGGFVFYLMLGILAWTFFASSMSAVDRRRSPTTAGWSRASSSRARSCRSRPCSSTWRSTC